MDNTEKQLFIEEHLHSQFAQNINNNLTAFITIAIALFSVIGAYGYVFVMSENHFATEFFSYNEPDKQVVYNLSTLTLAAGAVILILGILFYISLTVGFTLRKEQFIVNAIRKNAGIRNMQKASSTSIDMGADGILIEGYHPYGKGWRFIPGLFGEFLWICALLAIIVAFSLFIRIGAVIIGHNSCISFALCSFFIVTFMSVIIFCLVKFFKKKEQYIKFESEYANYQIKDDNTNGIDSSKSPNANIYSNFE